MTELFGTGTCQFTAELRQDLEWRGLEFDEYDVETDTVALERMLELTGGSGLVPVLVVDGVVAQIGIGGRGCYVTLPDS